MNGYGYFFAAQLRLAFPVVGGACLYRSLSEIFLTVDRQFHDNNRFTVNICRYDFYHVSYCRTVV